MQNQIPKHYMISKWSKGETVERSMRGNIVSSQTSTNQTTHTGNQQYQTQQQYLLDNNNEMNATSAIQTSIHTNGIVSNPTHTNENGFTRQTNKRDAFNEMLSHRDLHTQVGQNPFLAGESYLQHLSIQENFLRPQNTNVIEPKTNS